jgi:Flp pilus assembly protein TadB
MEGVLIPLGAFAMVVLMVWIVISRGHKERMELIKQGINPDTTKVSTPGTGSLLWGLLLAAVGLGLVITFITGHGDDETLSFGLVLLLGGVGLIVYYVLTKPQRERAMRLQEQLIAAQAAQLKPQEKVESEGTPEA